MALICFWIRKVQNNYISEWLWGRTLKIRLTHTPFSWVQSDNQFWNTCIIYFILSFSNSMKIWSRKGSCVRVGIITMVLLKKMIFCDVLFTFLGATICSMVVYFTDYNMLFIFLLSHVFLFLLFLNLCYEKDERNALNLYFPNC